MSSDTPPEVTGFRSFNLAGPLLKALDDVGYETPTPIQAGIIPPLLEGRDVLGQAQTGTGKTAAFALPLLARLDLGRAEPQVLVLAPTRELAIQVAEAFQRYASHLKGFRVLPVYGGQGYDVQLRQLKRGVHVVVGTPGRVMDHIRRKTLALDAIRCLVLDEADEMLRMGFIDDVEWILGQTPAGRQIALFSATLPAAIRRIAKKHLRDPLEVTIAVRTTTADTIRHRYWLVDGVHKLEALTRILESEPFDGMLVFVRTKTATAELAEKLEARGYAAAPLSGDIAQKTREKTVEQLKKGKLDILVATDVAARGLDLDRVSHVINYDIPHDTESYVHRVGRTGRAGRAGDAILFVSPRERRMLGAIEKATRQKIDRMTLPSAETISNRRIDRFKQRITDTLAAGETEFFARLLEQYCAEHDTPPLEVAAALARMVQGEKELTPEELPPEPARASKRPGAPPPARRPAHADAAPKGPRDKARPARERPQGPPEAGTERFRLEVGEIHGVKPANIVGALSNESGLDGEHIGRVRIHEDYSTVDLPEGMPKDIFMLLKKVWVCNRQLAITRLEPGGAPRPERGKARIEKKEKKKKTRERREGI
ncbi:MAG: DEAD/DEAH box helicase [Acidobacteria bacterium]|nr:DEAD/DEAH box helicase [Acidobacteriota bacterium]